ncbi:MAG: pilus assembly protein [Hyphomicrobiales bacterium]|nr:pilus assembly protein [Hyphomicrobiales bacterium]
MNRLRVWLADKRGSAAVEFGAVGTVLVMVTVCLVDIARMGYRSMAVKYAVETGAIYAAKHGFNATSVSSAVTASTSASVAATPAPYLFCGCPTGSAVTQMSTTTDVTTCSASTCTGGGAQGGYASVSAQANFSPYFGSVFMQYPSTLSAKAVVRLQ